MAITLSTSFVQVTDVDAAVAFYRDVLGLAVYNDVANGDFRWVTIGSPSQAGVSLVLTNFVGGSPEDVDLVAALVTKGALGGVHFHSDDLDATFEKVKAAGAEVISEPNEQPWGARDFAVRDPSGNQVRINS